MRWTWLLIVLVVGCDHSPRGTADSPGSDAGTRPMLPKPDPTRMSYDPAARILQLYELPDEHARWMMITPRNRIGEPVSLYHVFMDEVDLDGVMLFVTTGHLKSPKVSLREILSMNIAQAPRQ